MGLCSCSNATQPDENEEVLGLESVNICENFQHHIEKLTTDEKIKKIKLSFYDIQIRDASYPMFLIQINDMVNLIHHIFETEKIQD